MLRLGKKSLAIGGVVLALAGTAAFAMQGHGPKDRAKWATERVTERLELNDSQKAAFSKVAESYSEIRGTAPEFMLDLSAKLKELASDETLTEDEVNALRTEIKAEFDRRTDILIPEFVAFYNTLDEGQREKVVARLDKISERIEHRAEKRANKN